MKNINSVISVFLVFICYTDVGMAEPSVSDVLFKLSETLNTQGDFSSKVKVLLQTEKEDTRTTEFIFFQKRNTEQNMLNDFLLVVLTAPEAMKGNGFLSIGEDAWVYLRNAQLFQHVTPDMIFSGAGLDPGVGAFVQNLNKSFLNDLTPEKGSQLFDTMMANMKNNLFTPVFIRNYLQDILERDIVKEKLGKELTSNLLKKTNDEKFIKKVHENLFSEEILEKVGNRNFSLELQEKVLSELLTSDFKKEIQERNISKDTIKQLRNEIFSEAATEEFRKKITRLMLESFNGKTTKDMLGKIPVYKFELSTPDKKTKANKQVWQVRQDNFLPLKIDIFSKSDAVIATTYFIKYVKIGERYFPSKIMNVNDMSGEETKAIVEISGISLKPLEKSMFTKAYLENFSR